MWGHVDVGDTDTRGSPSVCRTATQAFAREQHTFFEEIRDEIHMESRAHDCRLLLCLANDHGVCGMADESTHIQPVLPGNPHSDRHFDMGMSRTAADDTYGKQLLFGTLASAIAAVLIFAYVLFLMKVLAPNLIGEIKAMQTAALKAAGRTEAEIGIAIALQTPLIQAFQGALGTIVTGFLASAVIAIFLRKKQSIF
jgi:hypothetical protein